jgi:opacity protein-like surface antigen
MRNLGAFPLALVLMGAGYGQFQSAHTTAAKKVSVGLGVSFQGNPRNIEAQGVTPYNFPFHADLRVGVHEHVDVGATLFLLAGLVADTKVNLLPPDSSFALAVRAGLGAAADIGEPGAWILHLPVSAIASYTFLDRLSPYVGLGYGFHWIFGRPLSEPDPSATYAERRGHGDGVLHVTVGLEWRIRGRVAVVLEYSFLPAVVDDPGDNYSFGDNHMVGLAARF